MTYGSIQPSSTLFNGHQANSVKVEGRRHFGRDMDGAWGSIQADWRVLLLLVLLWYILLRMWERNGTLDKWNASRVFGFVLMVRAKYGLKALEKVAKPRRFWRIYGEVALWICVGTMLLVGLLMGIAFIGVLLSPPSTPPPSASELVAIPGINPMIPLGWGVMAFVVALVIHEFGHGLLARAHGMRIRAFGLLQLGPLPLGAFAEPQYEELHRAPRRERMRMFAAGPATNLFAAFVCLLMLGGLAGQVVAATPHPHARALVIDGGAESAGMQPWDIILAINGTEVIGLDGFRDELNRYQANDTVSMEVQHQNGELETLSVVLGDKYAYYEDLGWSEETLEAMNIKPNEPFLGVEGLGVGTEGVDRLAGPFSPRFEGGTIVKAIYTPFHLLNIMIVPFQLQGVSMYPMEESMLSAADDGLGGVLGMNGIMFMINFFFWLMWVNILLGFTNLIPMVPFDGGHLFKDTLHGTLTTIKKIGKKTRLWNIHPMWVDHISSKASRMSSLALLVMLVFMIAAPFF